MAGDKISRVAAIGTGTIGASCDRGVPGLRADRTAGADAVARLFMAGVHLARRAGAAARTASPPEAARLGFAGRVSKSPGPEPSGIRISLSAWIVVVIGTIFWTLYFRSTFCASIKRLLPRSKSLRSVTGRPCR